MYFSKIIEIVAAFFWIHLIIWVSYHGIYFQVCLYHAGYDLFCYNDLSPTVIFIVFCINSYYAYIFGIVSFLALKMIFSSYNNKTITDG